MKIRGFAGAGMVIALVCLLQNVANAGVVISEFRTRGPAGALDEFIELYNNSDGVIDISGWKINGSNSSGTTSTRLTINAGTMIPARGHFLATNSSASGYSGTVVGDQTYTTGITDDGGIDLVMPDGTTIVDQVGMSVGSAYKEGNPLTPLTANTNQGYERKPGGAAGSTQATNDNTTDFQLRSPSDPQSLASPPTPNSAAPGVVTTTNDSGAGSLRQTIADSVDGDTITFALALPATITLTSGELVIDKNVTINGPGAGLLAVSGGAGGPPLVFHISPGKTVTISGLSVTRPGGSGGGIYNDAATLTVKNCLISNHYGVVGGGINNTGSLTVTNSTLNFNRSGYGGAGGDGGGIANSGTAVINNSTLNNNRSTDPNLFGFGRGGAVANHGALTVNSSTLNGNSALHGGGIYNSGADATLEIGNTILNNSESENIFNDSGAVISDGYNLSNDNGGGFLTATGDQINTDPQLDAAGLKNNGGPTQTIALMSNSPAINSGDPNAPGRDQRYYLRNGAPDKGAFEYGGTLAPMKAGSRKAHGSPGSFDVDLPLTGTAGVECRSGGGTNDYQLILTFASPVTVNGTPQAQVTTGIGQVGSGGLSNGGVVSVDSSGATVTVRLTNVSNAQRIAMTLFGVTDGSNTNDVIIPMSVLAGDTTANGAVNSSDIAQTQSQSGQLVTSSNFREDVTVNGSINSSDVALVQSKSGTGLPAGSSQSQEDPITTAPKHRGSSGKSF